MIDALVEFAVALAILLAFLALLVGSAIAVLLFCDRLTRPSKEAALEHSRRFTERLQNPDFEALRQHFGCPLPLLVQALYGDTEELMRPEFQVSESPQAGQEEHWSVATYLPADLESVASSWPGLEKYFAFADDGCGDEYVIDPKEPDPAVLFFDHETGELSHVCDHFSQFMKWPRLNRDQA